MVSESTAGKMDRLMKGGILTTKNMDMANLSQKMIKNSRENGSMERDKEGEF